MSNLSDLKPGDTIILNFWGKLSYQTVKRATETLIIIQESDQEYKFRKTNGRIAESGYECSFYGKPRIESVSEEGKRRVEEQLYNQAVFDAVFTIENGLPGLTLEKLNRIIAIIKGEGNQI